MNILNVGPIERLTCRNPESPDYSRHVWYDTENGRLVATNGHALAIAAVEPEAGDVTGLVTVAAISYARIVVRRVDAWKSVKCEQDRILFADGTTMERPEGDFPDYAAIIPQISGPPTLTFNPELLAQIVAAFPKQEIGKSRLSPGSISMWVVPSGESLKPSPIVVKAHYDGGLAVLMPVSGLDPQKWNTVLPTGKKGQGS